MQEWAETDNLAEIQEVIEASDEEVAARAKPKRSTKTFQKAKKGEVPLETRKSFLEACESLRLEKIERLSKLKIRTAV